VHAENGELAQVLYEETEGVAVRVLVECQWGFAAAAFPDRAEQELVHAVAQARSAGRAATSAGSRRLGLPGRPHHRLGTFPAVDELAHNRFTLAQRRGQTRV
jgi:predicted Zn-dependent protease